MYTGQITIITIVCLVAVVIMLLGKMKLLRDILIVFVAATLFYVLMEAIPEIRFDPIYSMFKWFYGALPEIVHGVIDYFTRLIGGLPI